MTVVALSVGLVVAGADPHAVLEIERMFDAWHRVDALSYRLDKTERLRGGELVHEAAFVKVRKPDSYYIAAPEPRRGQEVIYVGARDEDRFVVHPGRFPDITLELAVRGGLATRRQHHLVTHSGLQYTIDGLRQSLLAAREGGDDGRIVYTGTRVVGGRRCHAIETFAGSAKPANIAARDGEPLFDFAERVGQDAYVIYASNPEIDDVTDELGARDYVVPAYYSSHSEWMLDEETSLPLRVTFWDTRGSLYERYEYTGMRINPPLTDLDFDPENPRYDF
jgi:hypothetical protein